MTEIPIQNLMNKAIAEERREKKEITSWHISKLGSCLRGLYLERMGVEPDQPFDDRTLRIFNVGNIFEDWLTELLKKKLKLETQVRVEDKKLNVSGYADAVIEYEGKKKAYEIKTKNSRSFWYMQKEGKPMRQHEYQLFMYLYLLDIDEGSIVYISKDDLAILEYPVFRNDKKLEKEVMDRIGLLNKAWKLKDPSVLPLPDKKDWQAKYCRWHNQCKAIKKKSMEINQTEKRMLGFKKNQIVASIWNSRNEPVLALQEIAKACGDSLSKQELEAFVEELQKVIKGRITDNQSDKK